MMQYWPWWAGAVGLGGVTVLSWFMLGRLLGVSGSWARLAGRGEERELEKVEAPFRQNRAAMEDALLAATLAEFGERAALNTLAASGRSAAGVRAATTARTSWGTHVTFLLAMGVGGFLAALSSGQFQLHFDLGTLHTRLFGNDSMTWLLLLLGGGLVGFGTQMAGGCTSGHGLSGASRLVPASLIATVAFFGTAVAVSFLIEMG
jgi:hypothetical protein